MDNVYTSFGRDIQVSQGSDGPLFNGHPTVHAALLENDLFCTFEFSEQSIIVAHVMNDIYPLPANERLPEPTFPHMPDGRIFVYTYEWFINKEDWACMVLDTNSGDLVFDEWFSVLKKGGVMDTVDDHKGLLMHLLKHGELTEGDILRVQVQNDGNGLET